MPVVGAAVAIGAPAREAGRAAMAGLKALIARGTLPGEGFDEFLDLLRQCVRGLGASDPELLALAIPFRDHITGDELRALRLNLDRALRDDSEAATPTHGDEPDPSAARYDDLLASTSGRRALIVGGAVREDARRVLQAQFEFDRLDWEPYDETRPTMLEAIEQRVRSHVVDLVFLLRSSIGVNVADRLRPVCQQSGVTCVLVDRGYGPAQVGEALRRSLPRSAV